MSANYVLYIDDSGTKEYEDDPSRYNLRGRGNSRYFVLCGVLVSIKEAANTANEVIKCKVKHFGNDTVEIKSNWLRIFKEQEARYLIPYQINLDQLKTFTDEYYEIINKSNLMLIASIVDKLQMQEVYKSPWYAPTVAYETLMMRVQADLTVNDRLAIVIDDTTGKTPKGNDYRANMEKHHLRLKKHGSSLLRKMTFHSLGTQRFVNSASSHLVQLADICAYNVHRQFQTHGVEWESAECQRLDLYKDFGKIHTKFRNSDGVIQGWGIIKMPQKLKKGWGILK